MPHDGKPVRLARSWWVGAHDDLRYAERGPDIPFACGFHCQQAAEKGIKAVLVLHQIDFPRTHDLDELVDLLPGQAGRPDERIRTGLEFLTRFAVETRYPPGEATLAEAERALALARAVLEWLGAGLPPGVTGTADFHDAEAAPE